MGLAFPKPSRPQRERKGLRRHARLQAKRWGIRPRRPRAEDRAGYDLARRDWCRLQDCIAGPAFGCCSGPIDPHHAAKKSERGGRADDTTVPLCRGHHDQITGKVGGYGAFQQLGREGRRELQNEWVAESTARYLSAGSRRTG